MIGDFSEKTNPVQNRDLCEYGTYAILKKISPEFQKQGVVVSAELLQEIRDNWKDQNGNPMDFTRTLPNTRDFENLVKSTGLTSYGDLENYPSLKDGIKDVWSNARKEFYNQREKGNYLHVITDPEVRSHLFNHQLPPSVGVMISREKSIREASVGDNIQLYDQRGRQRYSGVVGDPIAQQDTPIRANVRETLRRIQEGDVAPPTFDEADFVEEQFLGWEGGEFDGKQYRGLQHVIGAYLTKADAEEVAKNFDSDVMIDAEVADNSLELLKHLRSNGYDFKLSESDKPNQIDVKLTAGEDTKIRIFDKDDNGKYIGRVYDSFNTYYLNVRGDKQKQQSTVYTPEDTKLLIDYVTGNKHGKVRKAVNTDSSQVDFDELTDGKYVFVAPHKNRYASLHFENSEEAKAFIEAGIADAQSYVQDEFNVDELQALIDKAIEEERATSPEFQEELEQMFSKDDVVREAQERAVEMRYHSDDGGKEHLEAIRDDIVGNYEDGFNPSFVADHMKQNNNTRNTMMAAIKSAEYDLDKIKGNDFAVNNMKERLVRFDPETAKSIEEMKEENKQLYDAMKTVQDTLMEGNFIGQAGTPYKKEPDVFIDEQGVIKWEAYRQTSAKKFDKKWQQVSGEIGQVMVPDENGIIKTKFQGDNNYGIVPGYTGYFTFEGDYDNRMERFRVKGFEQHLHEQLRAQTTHQMTRPIVGDNIVTTLDASSLNGLYHGDVYGKRIDLDFLETNQLNDETKKAVLTTLSNRVRFDNQFSDHATTSAETQANREYGQGDDTSSFSYWKSAGETNMRVLGKELEDGTEKVDIENYADLTMTGTGKTQGLIWYLTDGAEVQPDGKVKPSEGILQEDGTYAPDKTALKKLAYFDNEAFNAWDRTQMSANQLMTALRVDEGANTALMAFGGWTFDDSYVVSQEFADRNQVFGEKPNEKSMQVLDDVVSKLNEYTLDNDNVSDEEFSKMKNELLEGSNMMWSNDVIREGIEAQRADLDSDVSYDAYLASYGRFRSLQRGDKLSDFGGNKGTIGLVVDRNMSAEDAKAQKLEKEVAFMKANPELDVISAPYSMLSRHNAGVVKELMNGEPQDLVNPDTGEVYKGAMGKLNIIVTDMVVDDKTHAYTREDVLDGKGRKASGQLAWALQSKGATGIMNEIYGKNDGAWETYREYLIATGLDMKPNGEIVKGYQPHAGEERQTFEYDPNVDSHEFLDNIKEQGGFLEAPFDLKFKNGESTSDIPVLSASLRQNVELVDGSMRRSDFTNHYAGIYEQIGNYLNAESEDARNKAQIEAQKQFDKIQSTIIDRQFNGGHNGKHSFLRDKIMGKRMTNSATGVAVVDPRLEIGQAGMNQDMMDALQAEEGDTVMMFRDPVWRDGAIRAMTVVKDDSVHGVAFNPISDKSHDGDFDGDTYGLMKFHSKQANKDLVEKFSHASNLIDKGNGKDELYFQSGMDLASARAKAKAVGDDRVEKLDEKIQRNATSNDPRIQRKALKDLNEQTRILFREHSFGSDYVSLENDEAVFKSFQQMVDNRAKGKPSKVDDKGNVIKGSLDHYKDYHNGKKTMKDARDIQYATGVKSDDTGLAGAFSQRLVSVMRNHNITSALEAMYPVTQGTLQIKHDPEHAKVVNKLLTDDLNKTFRGKDIHNSKKDLTPNMFKNQLKNVLEKDMGVDVADEHLDAVTDVLTHEGKIVPLKDAVNLKGSPMDRVAYGGGYEELNKIAEKGESLLEGEQNKLFAPYTMRNADEKTKLAKKDTQRVVREHDEAEQQVASAQESKMPEKQLSLFEAEADEGLSL